MSIRTIWRQLFRRDPENGERSRELEDSLKVAEYRNLQAHDLLREALEDLIDTHVSEGRTPTDSEDAKDDP